MVKKRSFLKKTKQKNPIPSHKEKFHDFYFEENKIPKLLLHIGFVCHLTKLYSQCI